MDWMLERLNWEVSSIHTGRYLGTYPAPLRFSLFCGFGIDLWCPTINCNIFFCWIFSSKEDHKNLDPKFSKRIRMCNTDFLRRDGLEFIPELKVPGDAFIREPTVNSVESR